MLEKNPQIEGLDLSKGAFPVLHTMPARLVMVRHGESQSNILNRARKRGLLIEVPEGFDDTPNREYRLSRRGVAQALATGPWLRYQYPEGFDVIYASNHVRAEETSGHVCLSAGWESDKIRIDPLLGERDWGRFAFVGTEAQDEIRELRKRDPLHAFMPDGESMLEARDRTRKLLDTVARECGKKRVLVFSHGEYIEALWAEIAHMDSDRQREFFASPEGDIKNCQIVEFSAIDPLTNEYAGKLQWLRSSCPQAGLFGKWKWIERITFSPIQLIARAEAHPFFDIPEETDPD